MTLTNLMKTYKLEELSFEEFVSIIKDIPNEDEIYEKNLKVFEGLEDYIIKNVSGDRKADSEKLHLLKSNLLGWQIILIQTKGKPLHSVHHLEEKRQESIIRLEAMIEAALKDLEFRILRKQNVPDKVNIIHKTFESKLTDEEFEKILSLIQDIKLIEEPFGMNDLKNIFHSTTSKACNIKNNQHLAYLFSCLQRDYITSNWQSVIEDNKCFKGRRNSFLTASNLSASLQKVNQQDTISKKISTTIKNLKNS